MKDNKFWQDVRKCAAIVEAWPKWRTAGLDFAKTKSEKQLEARTQEGKEHGA